MTDLFISNGALEARPRIPEVVELRMTTLSGRAYSELVENQIQANLDWANSFFLAEASQIEKERESVYLHWASEKKPPFVYFMRVGPFVKIGTSKNPKQRVADMQVSLPVQPVIVGIVMGGTKVERYQHDTFWRSQIRGEWFVWSEEIRQHLYLRHRRYYDRRLPWKYE